jgi:hypothetical protein
LQPIDIFFTPGCLVQAEQIFYRLLLQLQIALRGRRQATTFLTTIATEQQEQQTQESEDAPPGSPRTGHVPPQALLPQARGLLSHYQK